MLKKSDTLTESMEWGQYYPTNAPRTAKDSALKVVLFGSTVGGMRSMQALATLSQYSQGAVHLQALVTDDPLDPKARISKQRRIWRYYKKSEQGIIRNAIVDQAKELGIDVFTGSVKGAFFKQKLMEWNPDLILVSCFGQIVEEDVFAYPKLGIYNIHPSDIEKGIGLGPRPFEDALNHGVGRTRITMHRLEAEVDGGTIIGRTGLININWGAGIIPERRVLILDQKMSAEFPIMAAELIHTACWKLWNEQIGQIGKLNLDYDIHKDRLMVRPERVLRHLIPNPLLSQETQEHLKERAQRIAELYERIAAK